MNQEEVYAPPSHEDVPPDSVEVNYTMRYLLGRRFSQICIICAGLSLGLLIVSFIVMLAGSGALISLAVVMSLLAPVLSILGIIAGVVALFYRSGRKGRYLLFSVIGLLVNGALLFLFIPPVGGEEDVIEREDSGRTSRCIRPLTVPTRGVVFRERPLRMFNGCLAAVELNVRL